ncbi:MAG: OmpH family outer membrane protein [Bacteroidetes bacterium]|nr:OmpH family outer membrane protein [Bacteroidota bacterium]
MRFILNFRFKQIAVFLMLIASYASASYAQERPNKIGFVNTGVILKEAPQARKVEEKLKSLFLEREKTLLVKRQELRNLETRIKQEGDIISAVEKRKLERELRLKLSQLKFDQQEFREDQNLRRNEEIRTLQTIIAKVIKTLGDSGKFDLILTEGVSYVSDAVDITPQIIEMLKALPEQESE